MAGPAAASSTYSVMSAPTVLNNDTPQSLGSILIDIPTVSAQTYSTILLTLPTDFALDWTNTGTSPVVSCVKNGKGAAAGFLAADAFTAASPATSIENKGITRVSAREFKVSYRVPGAGDADYDVRLMVTLPNVTVPSSADGDVKVTIDKLTGDFSSGSVVVGTAGSGKVSCYVSDATTTFTTAGTTGGKIEIYLKENTAGAIKGTAAAPETQSVKLKLPKGITWTNNGTVTNLTTGVTGVGQNLTATKDGSDARLMNISRASNTDTKSIYKIAADVSVDDSEAVLGQVDVAVSGSSSIDVSTVTIGEYVSYSAKLVNAKDPKDVTPGRTNQDVGDFNIEEGAAASLLNGRTITMELPDGVKWATLNAPSTSGTVTAGAITATGSDGRKVKFTVTNTPPCSKGKIKFTNVQVDVAADYSGDIKVTVDGAGVDNQSLVIAKAAKSITATADTTPEVIIGMQSQPGGTFKIVEGAKEMLINGKDLKIVAPSGVTWSKVPTVKVIDGDVSIYTDSITKNEGTVTIPIKSQSTKPSTIEISDVALTIDRTVPEGYITLKIKGAAVDEINNTYGPSIVAGGAGGRTFYATGGANPDNAACGLIFSGRDTAATVDVAKTVTPAPSTTKNKVTFKIGDSKFTLNGKEVTMDAAPYLKNDRTYLPVRFVAQAVGITDSNIIWNADEQTVVLIKDSTVVKLTIGSNILNINGIGITMDVAPEIVDPGRTMLPVRWVAQALGCNITWDDATQTVTVN
ncbi:copper amine oxidase N-terminal domain-containing protein [Pelotomaculum isophthalicicum JI]|uniref:Copper amine oxidase N-terminal domain-containing protein n=1 Tax=Pelotomaculum isophthalicicum JI TaxID=947010 RepID=A0A9X4H795_9FIRM|nr:copper amine oxidase N-terminal domain-containing protein [Pelotomaculum isophthalicicum]MDF9409872.1 copper amine oxidase N-terminal domain-containing protein [Pelotomaculum isophthalicicum JI]